MMTPWDMPARSSQASTDITPGGGRRAAADTRHHLLLRATLFFPAIAVGAVAAFIGIVAGSIAAGCVLVASTCIRIVVGPDEPDREYWTPAVTHNVVRFPAHLRLITSDGRPLSPGNDSGFTGGAA